MSKNLLFGDSTYQLFKKYADHAAGRSRSVFLVLASLADLVAFHVLWLCGMGTGEGGAAGRVGRGGGAGG